MRIDAHHHFWRYTEEDFGWISDEMSVIRRDFLPEDLMGPVKEAGMDGVVTVQARTSMEETAWLLDLWGKHEVMKGVVGWLPLRSVDVDRHVEEWADHPGLVGVREVLQGMPEGAMDDPAFNHGLSRLHSAGLSYDLLIVESQLAEAIRLVDRHSEQVFVLDHIAKPHIRKGIMEPWASRLRKLAKRPQVFCKLSGLVTEAEFTHWNPDQLRPYVEVVVDAFGPERVLAGSDWPVCLCGCRYTRWFELIDSWISELSTDEQAAIRGGNAVRIYNLEIE